MGWMVRPLERRWTQQLPPSRSGVAIDSVHLVSATAYTIGTSANILYAIPIRLLHVTDFLAIGVHVQALAALGNCRLGLYADNGGQPGALIRDVGVVSVATTGVKWLTMIQTLQPGTYWGACLFDSSPGMRGSSSTPIGPAMLGFTSGTDVTRKGGWSVAQGYGALPDPFTPGGALIQQLPFVCLWVSRAQYAYGEYDADLTHWKIARYAPILDIPYAFVSGRYYESPIVMGSTTSTTLVVTKDILYAVPFYVGAPTTFTQIGIEITAGVAGSNVRLGIYNMGAGVPTTLVLDAGAVATTGGGFSGIVIAQALSPGWYWLVGVFSHGPTIRARVATQVSASLGLTSNLDATDHPGWSVAQAYGALPDPFTGGGALMTTSAPRFMLKV